MAYTDFIAAIDLGSSHMVGMVGAKGPAGTLSIIAYEVENSDTCIRRGCVYNIKDAAGKIVRLIRKLENKLGGSRIGKIYVARRQRNMAEFFQHRRFIGKKQTGLLFDLQQNIL